MNIKTAFLLLASCLCLRLATKLDGSPKVLCYANPIVAQPADVAEAISSRQQPIIGREPYGEPHSDPLFQDIQEAIRESIDLAEMTLTENQYEELLERLRKEAEESVRLNPLNYISDDVDILTILDLIERQKGELSQEWKFSPNMVDDECPVCLDPLNGNQQISLPCRHVLHIQCLASWIRHRRNSGYDHINCPICRGSSRIEDLEPLLGGT